MSTHYEIRSIDIDGEAVDVSLAATLTEARSLVPLLTDDVQAWVIERRVISQRTGVPDRYRVESVCGNAEALVRGNWHLMPRGHWQTD